LDVTMGGGKTGASRSPKRLTLRRRSRLYVINNMAGGRQKRRRCTKKKMSETKGFG